MEMDALANRADYSKLKRGFDVILENMNKKPYFLKAATFKPPKFETVKNDIEELMSIGKIIDTSEYSSPLIAVNTYSLELLQYKEKYKKFDPVSIDDDDNLIPRMPRYFKYQQVSDDEILIAGGYDFNT